MDDSVEKRAATGPAPKRPGWAAPALIAGGRLADGQGPALGQPEVIMAAFVRGVARAGTPVVGPRVATLGLESSPIRHCSADRSLRVLPTYLRHPEVGA
jgi:hypothetical protein